MADYRTITDAEVDPDAPLTSSLGYAWRDNPIAITEGAVGAPRIQDAALGTSPTNAGRNWVQQRLALMSAGGVGSIVFATVSVTGVNPVVINYGDLVPATGTISPGSASGVSTGSLAGTWRCLGWVADARNSAPADSRTTLFLRVS